MSVWDKIGKSLGNTFGGVYHAVTGTPNAKQVREQTALVNNQIKAYKDQTEITKQELARVRGQEVAEKRRIEEKQIRSLRNNYSGRGLLGGSSGAEADMTSKLGG